MTGIDVRRYRATDRQAVLDLHSPVPTETPARVPDDPPPDLADVETYYLDAGGEFLVGTLDESILATAAYGPVSEWRRERTPDLGSETREVRRVRVHPEHRREGYGSALYDALAERAREARIAWFVLDIGVENEPARRFFESHGFEETGEVTIEIEDNPLVLATYRRALSA